LKTKIAANAKVLEVHMVWLITMVATFVVWNIIPASRFGAGLKTKFGKVFGPVFGVGSLILFGFLLWSFRIAERPALYDPPSWGIHANYLLSLLAFVCLGIGLFRGRARNWLRYPLAIGTLLWAAGHLLANGDAASVVFILGILTTVLLATYMRGKPTITEVRQGHDLLGPLFGVAFYAVAVQLHHAVIGVPVFELVK
jgi:uncharacterized membrane protein